MTLSEDNFIEDKYRNLSFEEKRDYMKLYEDFSDERLKVIFSTFHYHLIELFKSMNVRLPSPEGNNHYWAQSSRDLKRIILVIFEMEEFFKSSAFEFSIPSQYRQLYEKCLTFLQDIGGSSLPKDLTRITLPYKIKLFESKHDIVTCNCKNAKQFCLSYLGEGSYAHVYTYHDDFYDRDFILKRAKKDLSEKELARFKQEFDTMKRLQSPYIVEVYCYNEAKKEYIMERMDYTLLQYINSNIQKLDINRKKSILKQIYKAFHYIHKQKLLHRDISPNNILIKLYKDDTVVVKVADFGLVHIPDSSLTTLNTEWKGAFNDPVLKRLGFNQYTMPHEIYALTCVSGFVLTGKTNLGKIADHDIKNFIDRGLNSDESERYKDVLEMEKCLNNIK